MAMRRRKRRIRGILLTAGIIAAAAAILLGLFRIRKVEIVGNSLYTAEAIQEDLIYDFWTEIPCILPGNTETRFLSPGRLIWIRCRSKSSLPAACSCW